MNSGSKCVLLFASIHDVIAAEKVILAAQLWCDMVPTPRELSSDCGMSLEIRPEDVETIRAQLATAARNCAGLFRRVDGRFEAV